ncbi:Predicted membrane protein [Cnuella takakiae]|uniref:Predicted membrane protein n=2 Tax=Cnuella takakiae TaxID=1302690 RepID=A0A1M5C2I0_9BACT|nr:Predicted membrane protein [Cnuella takakiae]
MVRQLRSELVSIEQELRQQYARLQQVQQQLEQIDPQGANQWKAPGKAPASRSVENFIGLKLIHLVGIVVLVIGLSIGVKYAFDQNLISETTRILLAYAAGLVLGGLSFRLKEKYQGFSAILFSGAMATLYFTTYAAHVYYGFLSFGVVFAVMVLFTVFTAYQALRYNRREIALLGMVGAYAIPFLISRNAERADLFFAYMLLINSGVWFLSYRKGWNLVGQVAQLLTWLLFLGWASTRYRTEQAGVAFLYLTAFFLLFSLVNLGPRRQQQPMDRLVIYTQLANNLAAFWSALFVVSPALQVEKLAPVALVFSLVAAVQGFFFQKRFSQAPSLANTHYLLATGLLVMAIAWYFDGLQVTFIWLLLSVGLFLLGVTLKDKWWRLASLGLMALTLLKLLLLDSQRFTAGQKVAAYITLGLLLLVVSFFYQKFRQKWFEE